MRTYLRRLGPLLVALVLMAGWAVAQNSSGGAFLPAFNYIVGGQWTWRNQASPFIFEGTTDDAYETTFTVGDPTADRTFTLPDTTSGAFLTSTLTTNAVDIANSVWGISNGLVFEGATADAFEITIAPADVTADVTLTLPLSGAAAAAFMVSSLTTNSVDVANSIWGISNALAFGGATGADGFEIQLTPADVGADRVVTIPDMAAASALLATTLTTNAPQVANSVWGISAGFVFEGSDADTEELTFTTQDLTADITARFHDDKVDTYEILTMPDGDVAGGAFVMPPFGVAATDNDMAMTDNTLYVYRMYIPQWITVANIYASATQGAQIAGSDDILGVAIYEDADAGVDLGSAASADFTATALVTFDVTDVTLGPGMYRIAVCSGDADGIAYVAADPVDDEAIDVYNSGSVVMLGTGANACVAGDPPTTTGALTTADVLMPVLKLGP